MIDFGVLRALRRDDLLRLADLLDASLLTPPYGVLALRDHIPDECATVIAQCLGDLSRQDMRPRQIALLLRAYAAGAQSPNDVSPRVEVVVSGPDSSGGARDTGVVTRQLFGKARERVLAVGFAVHQGRAVFKALADRLDSDNALEAILCIDVRRQHGSTTVARDIIRRFASDFVREEWPGKRLPLVYFDPRSLEPSGGTASALHAKCVVIDGQEALVTSANFTEAAQERNIELGLLLNSPDVAGRIEAHFLSLIRQEWLTPLPLSGNNLPGQTLRGRVKPGIPPEGA